MEIEQEQEKELIRLAQKDPEAFGLIFDKYYPKISKYILRRTADPHITQDITSETFYKAFKNLWQFQWRKVPFSAWIYRIATNEINQYFRKNVLRKTVSLDFLIENNSYEPADRHEFIKEIEEAEHEIERHKDFLNIRTKIAKLPIKYQNVISLRFFEDKKIKEIAEILNKKEGTIKSLLSRGLEQLRKKYK